jgi:hypothetical protein
MTLGRSADCGLPGGDEDWEKQKGPRRRKKRATSSLILVAALRYLCISYLNL